MSDIHPKLSSVLRSDCVTLDDLFADLARTEADEVTARIDDLPTDVMLLEGAGALIDAAAALRFAASRLARPGSADSSRMHALAEELIEQAARFQHAGDNAAIAIRASGERHQAS